jgi:hypothetical protein
MGIQKSEPEIYIGFSPALPLQWEVLLNRAHIFIAQVGRQTPV